MGAISWRQSTINSGAAGDSAVWGSASKKCDANKSTSTGVRAQLNVRAYRLSESIVMLFLEAVVTERYKESAAGLRGVVVQLMTSGSHGPRVPAISGRSKIRTEYETYMVNRGLWLTYCGKRQKTKKKIKKQ